MAKKIKPRADVAEITSGFEELPIINSRPIDVFVAPSRVPTSEAVNQLINSLERFNPALQNYKAEEYKTFTVEEEAKAEREFNITNSGRTDITTGDMSTTEGADVALPVLLRGGQGTMGAEKFLKGVMKLIKSIT